MASTGWQKRNASARALGYRNYYDYRAHDYGKTPPSGRQLAGEALARARGHRSGADLRRMVESGRVEIVSYIPVGERNAKTGRYRTIEAIVLDADGKERRFVLRGRSASTPNLRRLRDAMDDADVLYLDSPSLDVFGTQAAVAA